jgi:hypothetical protein
MEVLAIIFVSPIVIKFSFVVAPQGGEDLEVWTMSLHTLWQKKLFEIVAAIFLAHPFPTCHSPLNAQNHLR